MPERGVWVSHGVAGLVVQSDQGGGKAAWAGGWPAVDERRGLGSRWKRRAATSHSSSRLSPKRVAHGVREAQAHQGRLAGHSLVGCGAAMAHARRRRAGGGGWLRQRGEEGGETMGDL